MKVSHRITRLAAAGLIAGALAAPAASARPAGPVTPNPGEPLDQRPPRELDSGLPCQRVPQLPFCRFFFDLARQDLNLWPPGPQPERSMTHPRAQGQSS